MQGPVLAFSACLFAAANRRNRAQGWDDAGKPSIIRLVEKTSDLFSYLIKITRPHHSVAERFIWSEIAIQCALMIASGSNL